ncbi:hypothetical protein R2325_13945 [Mycobacteroides chelonae]|nr:hypothetical protein [Mycobacteroides chelonae]MEC4873127.1 hypothetical protein [Mycobacteroides chelonae]
MSLRERQSFEEPEPQMDSVWVPISSLPVFVKDNHRMVGESE